MIVLVVAVVSGVVVVSVVVVVVIVESVVVSVVVAIGCSALGAGDCTLVLIELFSWRISSLRFLTKFFRIYLFSSKVGAELRLR